MTIQRMIELLKIEHECILRAGHDDCDRNCADCKLVQDDNELHEMYTDVIAILKGQKAVKVQHYTVMGGLRYGACPKCDARIDNLVNPKACGFCGQELKWE